MTAHRLGSTRVGKRRSRSALLALCAVLTTSLSLIVPLRAGDGPEKSDESAKQATPNTTEQPAADNGADNLSQLVARESAKYGMARTKSMLAPVQAPGKPSDPSDVARKIDVEIDRYLATAKITPSERCDDAEFIRRVTVDLIGVIPTAERVRTFLADKDPAKREKLIDELLDDRRYGEHFAQIWQELFVKREADINKNVQTGPVFVAWMKRQLNGNVGWNKIVHDLLTAEGDETLAGNTYFIMCNTEDGQPAPNKIVATASALFLGNQMQCCECHDHPVVESWQQQDFWGLAAFFATTNVKREADNRNQPLAVTGRVSDQRTTLNRRNQFMMANLPAGSIVIPDPRSEGKIAGVAKAKLLDGNTRQEKGKATRANAADWFTSAKNPYFPRAATNRLWAHFFAQGFVNPLDDLNALNKPSHPALFESLSQEMVACGFDLKHMIRCYCRSQAYQRSSRTTGGNSSDETLYSHSAMKVLSPRSLIRSMSQVLGQSILRANVDVDPKALKREGQSNALQFYDNREYDESADEYSYGVPQLLRLMNTNLPAACERRASKLLEEMPIEKAIDEIYISALARPVNDVERKRALSFCAKAKSPSAGLASVLWAVLNSAEFVNNH